MKIIDFEKKGNVVRFYLGEKTPEWGWTNKDYKYYGKTPDWLKPSDNYYGDDWDDYPYEHNAGRVYDEFIKGYADISVNVESEVLEPCNGSENSEYSKNDMVDRKIPCIIVIPNNIADNFSTDFNECVNIDDVKKYYFGDDIEPTKLINY